MKLISIQLAIFSQDMITRPDLLFNEVNTKMGGVIDGMPTILNLPPEAPVEIPIVQAKSIDGHINVNVSKMRIDLIINLVYENDLSPLQSFENNKNILQSFYKGVLSCINANRTGFVLTLFDPREDGVRAIFNKYFSEKYTSKCVESSMRMNKQNMRKSIVYNNIYAVEAATINVGVENVSGVLFQYDINNAPEQDKKINEDTISYIISQGVANLSPESIKEMI